MKLLKTLSILVAFVVSCSDVAAKDPIFPVPDSFKISMVSDSLDFNGFELQPMEFETDDTEEEINAFYLKEWGREGIKYSDIPGWKITSHIEKGMLFTVQIPKKEGKRLKGSVIRGYLGISNLPSIKKLSRKLGKGFPMLPGTKVFNDILQNDLGKEARTLWMVNEKGVSRNLEHISKYYKSKGWTVLEKAKPESNGSALMMNKGGSSLDMSVQKMGKYTHILAVISE
ncbi:hypothetical protein [Pleionea sp. CnH1-48]|uniref:hypothetical protein n=1 Tax=Pleionea sp. CnH1-48 TaxID=2954494 RepID=UPI0020985127|nr:hypothetical protein [Pleionea sp. CnH1-48]MCO7223842.1 hypothetical protein [Pleionea sp. CnH1-48]